MTKPALARSTNDGRIYIHPMTGERVPSVTTIIGAGVPKPALPRWAAKMAAEYADREMDKLAGLPSDERITLIKGAPWRYATAKADLGSAVHDTVDAWCTGRDMPEWPEGVETFMEQFVEFLEARNPTFIENEVTVWSRTHGYAGTADWIADINSVTTLGDTKTGKGVYAETALQLSALSRADFILTPDGEELPLPDISQLGVLHLRPQSWALIPVTNVDETFDAFLAAMRIRSWTTDIAPTVLGARLKEVAG